MDEDLPIDIHYNKLQDWLVSRRHCHQNWQESVLKVRQLINVAIQDMPAVDSITELLEGTYINYFHCKEIIEILKKTEGSSKTLFGSYSSRRLQDWINIQKCYEKDNIFLAEAAQLLTRCANYDIPSLKKQINRSLQTQQDYSKKEIDCHRSSIEMREKFNNACKNLEIEGRKLKTELCNKLNDLPQFYEEIVEDVRSLQNEVDFYLQFVEFLSSGAINTEKHLPVLRHLMTRGNSTVYEWKNGCIPDEVIRTELNFEDEDEVGKETQNDGEIDWGNIEGASDNNAVEIDWGIEDISLAEAVPALEDSIVQDTHLSKVARGQEACSILEFLETRSKFLDDLHELEAFFGQHSRDVKSEDASNFLIGFIFQSAPSTLHVNADKIDAMSSKVRHIIGKFSRPNVKELLLMCSFPRYVDSLADNLKKIASTSEKLEAQSKVTVIRQGEVAAELLSLQPKLDVIRTKMRTLKKQVENEISMKYKGRKVNIMGEINSV